MKPSTDQGRTAYYRADVQGLNPGDATTRTLDPNAGEEYTYATTRLDVARAIAERHSDFSVYRVTLDEPIEADPDAAEENLGELFVRSPWGAVVDVVTGDRDGHRLPCYARNADRLDSRLGVEWATSTRRAPRMSQTICGSTRCETG